MVRARAKVGFRVRVRVRVRVMMSVKVRYLRRRQGEAVLNSLSELHVVAGRELCSG